MSPERLIIALHWRSFVFVSFGHLFFFFDFSILGFLVHDVLNYWDWGGYLIFPATTSTITALAFSLSSSTCYLAG